MLQRRRRAESPAVVPCVPVAASGEQAQAIVTREGRMARFVAGSRFGRLLAIGGLIAVGWLLGVVFGIAGAAPAAADSPIPAGHLAATGGVKPVSGLTGVDGVTGAKAIKVVEAPSADKTRPTEAAHHSVSLPGRPRPAVSPRSATAPWRMPGRWPGAPSTGSPASRSPPHPHHRPPITRQGPTGSCPGVVAPARPCRVSGMSRGRSSTRGSWSRPPCRRVRLHLSSALPRMTLLSLPTDPAPVPALT
jgi:hypothetical protein